MYGDKCVHLNLYAALLRLESAIPMAWGVALIGISALTYQ